MRCKVVEVPSSGETYFIESMEQLGSLERSEFSQAVVLLTTMVTIAKMPIVNSNRSWYS